MESIGIQKSNDNKKYLKSEVLLYQFSQLVTGLKYFDEQCLSSFLYKLGIRKITDIESVMQEQVKIKNEDCYIYFLLKIN